MHPQDTTPEEWRPIVGWEGWYAVSSLGRVRREHAGKASIVGRVLTPLTSKQGYCTVSLSQHHRAHKLRIHRLVAAAFLGPCPPGYQVNHKDGIKANNAACNLEYVTPSANQAHASRMGLLAFGDRNAARLYPERRPRGDQNGARLHPERLLRGDQHPMHLRPEIRPRGDRHGLRLHPERAARGDRSGARLHPERIPRGEDRPQAKLTTQAVVEMRNLYATGRWSLSALGARFGIGFGTVGKIVRRERWRHVP